MYTMPLDTDLLRVRTPDYRSARDSHVSNSLRGEERRGGRGEKEEELEEEKREGRKGEG